MNGKRTAEDTVVERRTRIKLASPSPERTSASDTESIHSCQGYKTEVANDTSDTSTPPPMALPDVEYEIAHPEVKNMKFFFSDESSEEDYQELSDFFVGTSNDGLDNALLGDTSEENSTSPTSNSDVDPGLPRNDYLDFEKCLLCKTDKKDISYPYCSACFTWRKNLFPNRPKKRKKCFRSSETSSKVKASNQEGSDTSGFQGSENGKSWKEKKNTNGSCLSDALFEDSGVGSSEPQLSEDAVDGPSQPSTSSSYSTTNFDNQQLDNSSNLKEPETCRVCFLKRENGLFVHSNSAHLYGCYRCAKEIWYHNGGCPICRRKVFKVTKLYI